MEVPAKYDYIYKRNGTANIFVAVDLKGGKRDINCYKQMNYGKISHYEWST